MRYDEVKNQIESLGYRFYDSGVFNVNLYGIRNGYDVVDEFNDVLGICFRDEFNNPVCIESKGTTKPGLHWLKNRKGNINGTFILQPGQYKKCWTFGEHKSAYDALIQSPYSEFKGWRDNDSDGELDINGDTYDDVTGLNMHTTSLINDISKVGAYSAGCQVRQDDQSHWVIMAILNKSAERYGSLFSYTLIEG